jgi:5-methylcytosine-specific restriction endonuclease McrA
VKKLRHTHLRKFEDLPAQAFRTRMPNKDMRKLPWNEGGARKPSKADRAAARAVAKRRAEQAPPPKIYPRPRHDDEWWVLRKAKVLAVGRCAWCGTTRQLTVDHIVPLIKGGSNALNNLQCLCKACNNVKGDHDGLFLCAT